ncbi:MAG: GUN4 domain-containing protein [Cyanobacteria bacterium J06626_18]
MARNWALVVGINNYNPLNFTPLKYAKRDAERVSEFFQAAGFEVRCFTDDSPPLTLPSGHTIPTQPTYGNLITFLQDRFESEFLTTGDNCWFFFAGHGERHQDRDYLMPIDANSRGAEVIAGLTINYVQERLSRCGADNVIMMLDACRSEGSRDGGGIRAETQKGLITIASCQPTQKSWELDELQQGAFTYALLEALQLPGEQSCATVERLSAYLNRRVPALCQQYGIPANKIPTPRISADPIEKQHFILIPQYARQADLDLLKLDAYRLQRSNPILAEQICIRLNALALGRDLEVFELLYKIRNAVRSHPNLPEDNRPDEAVPRSPNTAVTTTISDQLEKNRETPEPALNSELGIDYTRLWELLQAGEWRDADLETWHRMLEAVGRGKDDWIRADELRNFPCADLKTIDNLWQRYSGGNFGFTVQKKIWEECGSPTGSGKDWDRFCVKVGWQDETASRYLHYDELKANPDFSPTGEFPVCRVLVWVRGGLLEGWVGACVGNLFSRIQTCKL